MKNNPDLLPDDRQLKQVPIGYSIKRTREGYVVIEGYDETARSEGAVTVELNMKDRGAPLLVDAVPIATS